LRPHTHRPTSGVDTPFVTKTTFARRPPWKTRKTRQQSFNQEFYSPFDDDDERRPGFSKNVHVKEGRTTNHVTNANFRFSLVLAQLPTWW